MIIEKKQSDDDWEIYMQSLNNPVKENELEKNISSQKIIKNDEQINVVENNLVFESENLKDAIFEQKQKDFDKQIENLEIDLKDDKKNSNVKNEEKKWWNFWS